MPEMEQSRERTSKVCLLDFSLGTLQKILNNPEIAQELINYDESSPLINIDELINLHEAPQVAYLLNERSILEARREWTVEIPTELAEKLRKIEVGK